MKLVLFLASLFVGCTLAHAQQKGAAAERPKSTPAPAKIPVPAAAPTPNAAPEQSADDAPIRMAANFFTLLEKGEVDQAYSGLTRGSKIAERPEELKNLKTKTREAIEVFGPVLGFELVDAKNVGGRLLRRTYLSLGKEFPLRWRFYFYKSENAWRLIDLRVDDRVTGMFDETEEPKADANAK